MKQSARPTSYPAFATHGTSGGGHRCRWICLLYVACLGFVTAGCGLLHHETSETKSFLRSMTGRSDQAAIKYAASALQLAVMREADEYVGAIAQATDDFRARVPTLEARDAAQQWKLMEATAAYINASGENPALNAVDMVVLATLSRDVVEDYWVGKRFGEAARPLLETQRQLETNAWRVASEVLTAEQQADLRSLLDEYLSKYPDTRYVAAARLPELAATLGHSTSTPQSQQPGNLFNLLYLNPLAGLDPATRAIDQTRNLAQRALYYAQRTPMLLAWQVELTTYQLAAQPESRQVLADVDEVANSTKVFAQAAEGLPQLVNNQREAAINQVFDRLALVRTNLLADMAREEEKLRGLLTEAQATLQSGSGMADSVKAAIQSLDAFVRYVSPSATNAPAVPDTSSHPFNVLDYGKAASQVAVMAQDLNKLLTELNQSMPQATLLSQQAAGDLKGVVSHAFRLGLVLIGVMGLVAWLVALACHRTWRRAMRSEV